MIKLKTHMKKIIALSIAFLAMSVALISPAKAETTSEKYLKLIAIYTYKTADAAYYIEEYIYGILVILNSWILPDETDTSSQLQSNFSKATNTLTTNTKTQLDMQTSLIKDFYGRDVTEEITPYANDMTFGSLKGKPYFIKDPRSEKIDLGLNYITNVAGLKLTHIVPGDWAGTPYAQRKYKAFYTTVSAIQTYNSYILSQLYLDNNGKNSLSDQQTTLIKQASSSDWFTQVASENLGVVFRQMLMYNSQLFVLMTQLLQAQKQMLATLAMTNTLIVIGDSFTENQLYNEARSAAATPPR